MESSFFRTRALTKHPRTARGFTLVEMLVVLTIITVITMIALLGQGDFNRSILLTDTAYTVALSLREMQTLGLSSRKFTNIQNAGYGGYFTAASPANKQFILFADTTSAGSVPSNCNVGPTGTPTPESKPGDCIYTSGSDGIVQTYTFNRGFTISEVCGTDSGIRKCSSTGAMTALSIVFLRSATESMMVGKNSSNVWVPITKAEIYINSGNGASRAICVSQVGQISVAFTTCP